MSQLVAYYDENPVELKGQVEIHQSPILSAAGSRSVEGAIRTSLVYARVRSEAWLVDARVAEALEEAGGRPHQVRGPAKKRE